MLKMFMKNKKGFTLVELMVVVVILGILVAIAVPVYSNVQTNARLKAVDSNVRIIENAWAAYIAATGANPAAQTDLVPNYIKVWPAGPGSVSYTLTVGTGVVTTAGAIN